MKHRKKYRMKFWCAMLRTAVLAVDGVDPVDPPCLAAIVRPAI
jgi:hypothetical protein